MRWWTRRLAPSVSLDQNVRTALWALSLIAVLGTAVAVLSAGLPLLLLALALAGLTFLAGHWDRSRRVTRVRWTGDVLDALAVAAVVAAVPGSNQVLTLPTSAILLRSIRPGRRAAVLRLALHCAAIGAGTLAAGALAASVRGVRVSVVDRPTSGAGGGQGLWSVPGSGSQRPADRTVAFGARQDDGALEVRGPLRAVEEVVPSLTALAQYVGLSLQKCQALEELRQRAETDGLTGLVSAETFRGMLRALVAETDADGDADRHGTLLVVDCDDFKAVNDPYGHLTGDAVLLEIAQRLRTDSRAGDVVARLGGDEFAVLLAPAPDQDTDARVERLTAALARPVDTGGHHVATSCSVGSTRVLPGRSLEELVRAADSAMYTAKAAGKGRHVTADAVALGPARAAAPSSAPPGGGESDGSGHATVVDLVAAER